MSRFGWLAVLFLLTGSSSGLSFDCAKPANADENKICSEVVLARLDDEFSNRFKLVKIRDIAEAYARDYAPASAK